MTRKYDEGDITGFTRDLEKIQAKPTLYIGPTDNAGIFTVVREPLDNGVDEARAGRNNFIFIEVESLTGPFTIVDRGVGIPVKKHAKMGISTLTHVLTNLQSSGKMKVDGAYKSAVGTHGVGIKATNALSSEFEVFTYREDAGGWFNTKFRKGREKQAVKKCAAPKVSGLKINHGTVIRFTPDPDVFKKSKLEIQSLMQWAEMTAHMNAGLKIVIKYKGKTKEFYSKEGIKSYLLERIEKLKAKPLSDKHIFHASTTLEMAMSFTDVEGSQVEFFTNTVRNVEEGVHATAVYKALYDSLKPFMKSKMNFTSNDVRDGLLGIVNYKIDAPQFDSQTKEKLVDDRVKEPCYAEALEVFSKFWVKNKGMAKDVVSRASLLRSKTEDFLKDKKLVKNVNAARKRLETKLADIVGNAPVEQRELFIVEGDSAGGGAKRARNKMFQAIYPTKGKPLNVMEAAKAKVNSNAEIVGLLAALGVQEGSSKKKFQCPYGKIILMADADVDGSHINVLLLAIIYKYMPSLIDEGRVYAVKSPLFMGKHKGGVFFGMTREEVWKKAGAKCDATYLKGWGELNPEDLGIALDPGLRTLYRIVASDRKGKTKFELLTGKKVEYRRELFGVAA